MGTDVTKVNKGLCGFVVPHPFSETLAADYRLGTDYEEASREFGGFVSTSSSPRPIALDPFGNPASSLDALSVRPASPGAPGSDSALWLWSSDASTWYGRFKPRVPTYYSGSVSSSAERHHVRANASGEVLHVASYSSSGALTVDARVLRSTASDITDVQWTATTGEPSTTAGATNDCVCVLVDPTDPTAWLMYAVTSLGGASSQPSVDLYRLRSGETAWELQKRNCIPGISGTAYSIRAASSGGQVLLLYTRDSTTRKTRQYASADGGATFESVGTEQDTMVACDVAVSGGRFVSLTLESISTTGTPQIRRCSNAFTALWDDTATELSSTGTNEAIICSLAAGPGGRLTACFGGTGANGDFVLSESYDYGTSWTAADGISLASTVHDTIGSRGSAWWRGKLIVIGGGWDVTGAAISAGQYTIAFGAYATNGCHPDFGASATPYVLNQMWLPYEEPLAPKWGISDTGSPTKVFNQTGLLVTCGAGDTSAYELGSSGVVFERGARFWYVYQIDGSSGTHVIKCEAGNSTRASVTIEVNSTQIRAYPTGGTPPSFTTHGITSEEIEILACLHVSDDACTVYYGSWSGGDKAPSALTVSGSILVGSRAGTFITATWGNSVGGRMVGAGYVSTSAEEPLADGVSVDDLTGVPLHPGEATYLHGGCSVRAAGGIVWRDGSYWTSTVTSPYPKVNTLPRVEPSPSRGWRTDTAADTSLRYTMGDNGESEYIEGDSFVVYLDGLVGVQAVEILDGSTSKTGGAAVSIGHTVAIERASAESMVVRPATSGTDVDGPWVEPDEMKGWQIEFASGDVREIVGNTEGTLSSGATVDTKRATLRLASSDGSESTSGNATLYPPRACFVFPMRGSTGWEQVRVNIASGDMSTEAAGYVQVGNVVAGALTYLGRAPDKTQTTIIQANTETFEREDGTRVVRTKGAARSRLTMSWVDDPDDITQIGGDSTSPDYINTSDNASSVPAATRHGYSRVLRGIYNKAGGDAVPLLYVDGLARDPDTSPPYQLFIFQRAQCIYGRFVGDVREERVPRVGKRRSSEMVRVPTITIEEEL